MEKSPNVLHRYEQLVKLGNLHRDTRQLKVLLHLQELLSEMERYGRDLKTWRNDVLLYGKRCKEAIENERRRVEKRDTVNVPIHESMKHNALNENSSFKKDPPKNVASWIQTILSFGNGGGWQVLKGKQVPSRGEDERLIEQEVLAQIGPPPESPTPPNGIYLHGSVGSGKTMLMDLFFEAAKDLQNVPMKRRLHSNAAWLEFHTSMNELQKIKPDKSSERSDKTARLAKLALRRLMQERLHTPLEVFEQNLAAANARIMLCAAKQVMGIGKEGCDTNNHILRMDPGFSVPNRRAPLLCFDEIQTTDPFTVAALKAVVEANVSEGGVIVATSNRAPANLSPHGLHEAMFHHLQDSIERNCTLLELSNKTDYRRQKQATFDAVGQQQASSPNNFIFPLNHDSENRFMEAWGKISNKSKDTKPIEISVAFGRKLSIKSRSGRAAMFDFDELCDRPLGLTDYSALANAVDVLFLRNIPVMSVKRRDLARRFISLVDEIYENKCRLVCIAEAPIDELFSGNINQGDEPLVDLEGLQSERGTVLQPSHDVLASLGGEEERFAFARAISRLHEICY